MDCQYYGYMPERPVSLSAASLRLVGHVGQVTLDRMQEAGVARLADFDQHVAAVRSELTVACELPSEIVARPGREADPRVARTSPDLRCPDVPFASSALSAAPVLPRLLLLHYACGFVEAAVRAGWRPSVTRRGSDWESMRLAAICHLVARAEAADALHPDLRALS
jgi:Family of unknown function (DUF6401)